MDPKDSIVTIVNDVAGNGGSAVIYRDTTPIAVVVAFDDYRAMVDQLATAGKEG